MTVEPMPTPMLERRAEQLEDDDALDRLVERLQRVAASVVPEGRLRQELRGSTSAGIAASMLGVGVVTVSGYLGGHLAIGRAEPSASATGAF